MLENAWAHRGNREVRLCVPEMLLEEEQFEHSSSQRRGQGLLKTRYRPMERATSTALDDLFKSNVEILCNSLNFDRCIC